MIVVDTNVIAYLFLEGEKTATAQEVKRLDPSWLLPPLWRHEFLNVLVTYAQYGGGSREAVEEIWEQAIDAVTPGEREVDMGRALELAIQHNISAYDAQFIALAQSMGTYCVTEDRRLLAAIPDVTVSMEAFCRGV